ncbi:hypothetical protein HSX37_07985|uniref:Uncharacterized protein n=1 Tax=Dendrosporobacter quercicolus TaxID=146817 RepID=A0A1G9UYY6_9FIRM|nr:hypothetical protein [Dendrosporobacter quercicolus]NSL47981.1 hypothetical protein [Dendrosporobacter quercicolus DSM 1736]SDM65083.1 hypothetical protein SAMN04488502_106112 [Dendrosporobacter quercicolus]
MNFDWYYLWAKTAFILNKYLTVWVICYFLATAFALSVLGNVLERHNSPRLRETKLARQTAVAYLAACLIFWLFGLMYD